MLEKLQINITYDIIEDRLLMRVAKKEMHGEYLEYRLWFTRRFVTVFMKATDKIIEDGLAGDLQVSPDSLDAMKRFQEESALAKADFATGYDPDMENFTLIGEKPHLVSKINVKKPSGNRYVFSFLTNDDEGINITADTDLVYSLRKMFFDVSVNAGWNNPLWSQRDESEVKKQ